MSNASGPTIGQRFETELSKFGGTVLQQGGSAAEAVIVAFPTCTEFTLGRDIISGAAGLVWGLTVGVAGGLGTVLFSGVESWGKRDENGVWQSPTVRDAAHQIDVAITGKDNGIPLGRPQSVSRDSSCANIKLPE